MFEGASPSKFTSPSKDNVTAESTHAESDNVSSPYSEIFDCIVVADTTGHRRIQIAETTSVEDAIDIDASNHVPTTNTVTQAGLDQPQSPIKNTTDLDTPKDYHVPKPATQASTDQLQSPIKNTTDLDVPKDYQVPTNTTQSVPDQDDASMIITIAAESPPKQSIPPLSLQQTSDLMTQAQFHADFSHSAPTLLSNVSEAPPPFQPPIHPADPGTPPSAPVRTGGRRGRGPRRRLDEVHTHILSSENTASFPGVLPPPFSNSTPTTPTPRVSRGRGRGSRGGRPRGSGAGRGRGRGSSSAVANGASSSRGSGRRQSGVLGKRKRSGSDSDDNRGSDSSSSSEEFTSLPSQSRSGRKIFQTAAAGLQGGAPSITLQPGTPPEGGGEGSAALGSQGGQNGATPTKTAAATSPASSANKKGTPTKKHALFKRGATKRTPGASAVCKNCGRGHSPAANLIVFCDGCDSAWHQHCHSPPIRHDMLAAEKDWFCGDCALLKEHSAVLEGKVAGAGMSVVEKRKYLKTLSPSALVSLLLHATALHPNLPIFPPKPQLVTIDPLTAEADGAMYELVEDELPYPKAGDGIQLPSENMFAHLLVDDDTSVYSHRWHGIGEMMAVAGWPARTGMGVRTGNAALLRAGA